MMKLAVVIALLVSGIARADVYNFYFPDQKKKAPTPAIETKEPIPPTVKVITPADPTPESVAQVKPPETGAILRIGGSILAISEGAKFYSGGLLSLQGDFNDLLSANGYVGGKTRLFGASGYHAGAEAELHPFRHDFRDYRLFDVAGIGGVQFSGNKASTGSGFLSTAEPQRDDIAFYLGLRGDLRLSSTFALYYLFRSGTGFLVSELGLTITL